MIHSHRTRATLFSSVIVACVCVYALQAEANEPLDGSISAFDERRVTRKGKWTATSFRNAAQRHLHTTESGASLKCRFVGTGVVIRLAGHAVPAYGSPNLGRIEVLLDGEKARTLYPRSSPREIVVRRGLEPGEHTLRVEHVADDDGAGCRIEGFRVLSDPAGNLDFTISGEEQAFLVDVRAVLRRGGTLIRDSYVRNWLTGGCRLAGLPPGEGYAIEVSAAGWQTKRVEGISIAPNGTTTLPPFHLVRSDETRIERFRFPALNRPAIQQPGQTFRARFLGFDTTIDRVTLRRSVGPAVISRKLKFEEDRFRAFYYDREVVARLPDDIAPGAYDLLIHVTGGRRTGVCRSPQSVHVVASFPTDPVFVTFGHLDTWGQHQAEYLSRLVDTINLIAPDAVLISNAVNPAYVSGALSGLDMPYVINFGNHQFAGHEKWYGDPVNVVSFGPNLSILNFGHPWHTDRTRADGLLAAAGGLKVINAFEHNAPVDWLDRHKVRLVHDAHGPGKRVLDIGSTPTRRVGKTNSNSFRVVRFDNGHVTSCTYNGHETAAIPFARKAASPLRVDFSPSNDGTSRSVTATLTNDYLDGFSQARVTFVLPVGEYEVNGGRIDTAVTSDDGRYTVLNARANVSAQESLLVRVSPK